MNCRLALTRKLSKLKLGKGFIHSFKCLLFFVSRNTYLIVCKSLIKLALTDFKKLRKRHCFSRHQCRKRISIGLSLSQVRAILDMKMQLCIDFGHLNDYADRFSSSILRKFRWIHPVLPKGVSVAAVLLLLWKLMETQPAETNSHTFWDLHN